MWRTSLGKRVLKGDEWELFREGLWAFWDRIEVTFDEPDSWPTGVAAFDRLSPVSKLTMLAWVGIALCDEREPCPPLNALTESTIGAIYAVIRAEIDFEIEYARENPAPDDEPFLMRTRVLAATRETRPNCENPKLDPKSGDDGDDESTAPSLPAFDSEDGEAWDDLVDDLMDRILGADCYYDVEDLFLDTDPRVCRQMKLHFRVDEDYFAAIAPDPTGDELPVIRRVLRQLCGTPEPSERRAR